MEPATGDAPLLSKAFQATTVACSRCHDHKLEAISQRDYYALAGILMSSRWVSNTLDTPQRNQEVLDQLAAIKPKLYPALADWWYEEAGQIPRYLIAAQASIDKNPNAHKLSEGLDSERLAAAEKALTLSAELKPQIEDVLYSWHELHQAASNNKSLETTWRELAEMYRQSREERIAANARDYTLIADFRHGVSAGWSVDGVGLRQGPASNGDLAVSIEGPNAVTRLLAAGLATDAMSPCLNGVSSYFLFICNHSKLEALGVWDFHEMGVSQNILKCLTAGYVLARSTNDDGKFTFIVDLMAF